MTVTASAPKARPTNKDLQSQIGEAHDCIHNVGDRVDTLATQMEELKKAVQDKTLAVDGLASRMAATDARVDLLIKFFGVRTPRAGQTSRRRITLGSLEWWQAVLGIAGSVLGALGAWKYLFPALQAFNHALLSR